jgi:hypothetical protein
MPKSRASPQARARELQKIREAEERVKELLVKEKEAMALLRGPSGLEAQLAEYLHKAVPAQLPVWMYKSDGAPKMGTMRNGKVMDRPAVKQACKEAARARRLAAECNTVSPAEQRVMEISELLGGRGGGGGGGGAAAGSGQRACVRACVGAPPRACVSERGRVTCAAQGWRSTTTCFKGIPPARGLQRTRPRHGDGVTALT